MKSNAVLTTAAVQGSLSSCCPVRRDDLQSTDLPPARIRRPVLQTVWNVAYHLGLSVQDVNTSLQFSYMVPMSITRLDSTY